MELDLLFAYPPAKAGGNSAGGNLAGGNS
jgi:hypothetical protein